MNTQIQKTPSETLKEAGDLVAAGWSPDQPVKVDADGNITHRCAATAMSSVPGGHPRAWKFLAKFVPAEVIAQVGLAGLFLVNKDPEMTQDKMVGLFRAAEADAIAAGE